MKNLKEKKTKRERESFGEEKKRKNKRDWVAARGRARARFAAVVEALITQALFVELDVVVALLLRIGSHAAEPAPASPPSS